MWIAVRDLSVLIGRVLYWASVVCSEVVLSSGRAGWPCERRCGARTCDGATTFREISLTIPEPARNLGLCTRFALCLRTWLETLNFLHATSGRKIRATKVSDVV